MNGFGHSQQFFQGNKNKCFRYTYFLSEKTPSNNRPGQPQTLSFFLNHIESTSDGNSRRTAKFPGPLLRSFRPPFQSSDSWSYSIHFLWKDGTYKTVFVVTKSLQPDQTSSKARGCFDTQIVLNLSQKTKQR